MEAGSGSSKGRYVLFFATKALLHVSFQLNIASLYCSIRNTCVNIPQVLVQKVNRGKTDFMDVGNGSQRGGRRQEGSDLEPVLHGALPKRLTTILVPAVKSHGRRHFSPLWFPVSVDVIPECLGGNSTLIAPHPLRAQTKHTITSSAPPRDLRTMHGKLELY